MQEPGTPASVSTERGLEVDEIAGVTEGSQSVGRVEFELVAEQMAAEGASGSRRGCSRLLSGARVLRRGSKPKREVGTIRPLRELAQTVRGKGSLTREQRSAVG